MHTGMQSFECTNAATHDTYDDIEPLLAELAHCGMADPRRTALRQEVIQRCLPLAEHIARKYGGRGENREDLLQTARVGLLNAVDRFDSGRGTTFLAFAVPTITGEVRRHFRDRAWPMRVPRRVQETRQLLGPAIEVLTQRLGRAPNATDIATELGLDLAEVVRTLVAANANQTTSIDAAIESDTVSGRFLCAEEPGYCRVEDYLAMEPLIATLSERERHILAWRYLESETQVQIARRLGISQIQVSRILTATLGKLRELAARD